MKYLSSFSFSFSLAVLLALPQTLLAEEVRVSCSNVADATERLACFDRTFPGDTGDATDSAPQRSEVNPIQTKPIVAQEPVQPKAPEASTRVEQPAPLTKGGMFSKKDKVNISSRLKSVRDKDKQKMIFLLENDQIWIQNAPRSLPFATGQDVSIKSGTVGGYSLSNAEGVSTRVSRIK